MSNMSVPAKFIEIYAGQHDVESVLKLFSDDFRVTGAIIPGGSGDLEAYKQVGYAYLTAFSDLKARIVEQIEDGERVVTHVIWSGTNTGALFGMPPTGKNFYSDFITIDTVRDGKIVERADFSDLLTMMQQLGVVPAFA